jgi:hypothetical protein
MGAAGAEWFENYRGVLARVPRDAAGAGARREAIEDRALRKLLQLAQPTVEDASILHWLAVTVDPAFTPPKGGLHLAHLAALAGLGEQQVEASLRKLREAG